MLLSIGLLNQMRLTLYSFFSLIFLNIAVKDDLFLRLYCYKNIFLFLSDEFKFSFLISNLTKKILKH